MTVNFTHNKLPVMIAIGGMSGSGKSTLAEELGKTLPNAVVLDSDVVHKQLHGIDPKTPLPDHAYTRENIKGFIRHIHREAERYLQEGKNVIVTGTFLDKNTRLEQEFLARRNDADFIGIYLHASAAVLFDRVAKRKDSVSDADKKVLRKQFQAVQDEQRREDANRLRDRARLPGRYREMNWHVINADNSVGEMLGAAVSYIKRERKRLKYAPQAKRSRHNRKIKPIIPTP